MTITQGSTRLVAYAAGTVLAAAVAFGGFVAIPAQAAGLTQAQITQIIGLLQAFGADQSTLNNVTASLNGQPTTGGTTTTTTTTTTGGSCTTAWTRNLQVGSTGSDVLSLQQFLNKDASTMVAASGTGSAGKESSTFGPATKAAVMKFQTKYGISPTGNTGPMTRAKLNALCGGVVTPVTPTPGTPVPTGPAGSATVSAAAQPANGIAPNNAARIPFTKFTITATGGDVTLNSVTVERDGIAQDAAFSGVMLLDQNGNQVGISRTLNSNHQATVGGSVVIPSGTTQTFTIAANRGTTSLYAGQIGTFSVVAINSNATVSGALPITGASYTINETTNLIGQVTAAKGTNDPGAANTENVGQTNYIFSSVRLTAGSQEPVYLKSIRWHQVGSASQSYLQNVVTVVDGTSYPTVVSSDNYYTTNFPGTGLLMDKGFSKDVAIQGDVVNGSNTNVEFDIQKATDINAVGASYGYGILPAFSNGSTHGQVQSSDDPYYMGFVATINSGTVTVSTSNSVSSSNVAINQQDQTIGGWSVQVQGEPITVGKMVFQVGFNTGSAARYTDVTSVKLVDQSGKVLAGPVDATAGSFSTGAVVTFTDLVSLPVGTTNVLLKGKLGTGFVSNDTIAASTTPSSQWTTVTGQTTSRSLTISPNSSLTSASQTLKAVALTASVSSVPIAQTIIAGTNQFNFANIILDGTQSGEDIRVTTIPVAYSYTGTTANANDLTNCQLYNGTTSVTDQHVVNPTSSNATGSDLSFALNSGGVLVPRGTQVTLSVKCDIRSGSTHAYKFGLNSGSTIGASGISSGQSVASSITTTNLGQFMTAASGGSLTVQLDPSSPGYSVASAGATGVTLGALKFNATNETVDLRQLALVLSSAAIRTDLVGNQVTLVDQSTNTTVGTAVFPTGANATSSAIASGAFRIPANGSRTLIIKGDLAGVSLSGPLTASGDVVQVAYDGANRSGTNGTYAVGISSGQNVVPTTASNQTPAGVAVYKSFPVFTYTGGGTATAGASVLLTLNVAADSKGDVTLNKLTFLVATTTSNVTGVTFQGPNGTVGTVAGPDLNNLVTVTFDSAANQADAVIGAGTTKTYNLRGTVALTGNTNQTGSISISLKGDSVPSPVMESTSSLASSHTIWSPESTSTSVVGTGTMNDWTNGYGLTGCFQSVGLGNDCNAIVWSK